VEGWADEVLLIDISFMTPGSQWVNHLIEATENLTSSSLEADLPRLGLIRYYSIKRRIELTSLVQQYQASGVTRRAWDDAKPYLDILTLFTPELLPEHAYLTIKRSEARRLAKALSEYGHIQQVKDAIKQRLTRSTFRGDWVSGMVALIVESSAQVAK
jgi:hypothetical protein